MGAKGLIWLKVEPDTLTGPTAKFFSPGTQQQLRALFGAKAGDLILIVADTQAVSSLALSSLRAGWRPNSSFTTRSHSTILGWSGSRFLDGMPKRSRFVAEHHPFTMPLFEDLHLLDSEPAKVRAQAYDLVVNGEECGGGTIRCHDPLIQSKIFSLLGLTPEEAQEKFGFLLGALRNGAPPHGGIALGFDRLAMLYSGLTNIRDCIAFPKTAKGTDLMTGRRGPLSRSNSRSCMCALSDAKQRCHETAEAGREQGEYTVAEDQEWILINWRDRALLRRDEQDTVADAIRHVELGEAKSQACLERDPFEINVPDRGRHGLLALLETDRVDVNGNALPISTGCVGLNMLQDIFKRRILRERHRHGPLQGLPDPRVRGGDAVG